MRVVPRVQSKLSRALHTHRGKKLLQRYPKYGKYGNKERHGKVQGSAGEGSDAICGMTGSLAGRHDGGPPVEGDLRQEAEFVRRGRTCWWDVSCQ